MKSLRKSINESLSNFNELDPHSLKSALQEIFNIINPLTCCHEYRLNDKFLSVAVDYLFDTYSRESIGSGSRKFRNTLEFYNDLVELLDAGFQIDDEDTFYDGLGAVAFIVGFGYDSDYNHTEAINACRKIAKYYGLRK